LFVPGNKHAVVGTKEGNLELIDVASSQQIARIEAHSGPVWSLAALPDSSGFVSGSADKDVKFWEWDLKVPQKLKAEKPETAKKSKKNNGNAERNAGSGDTNDDTHDDNDDNDASVLPQLTIAHTRTLTMSDDVLCVRLSPDGRLLAVSLLDSTVRVFFTESLKFFLSLYGHKLPVLCMDISSDGTLLATGSADKNLKIWGLDFGDCHRSLFAHTDSVMAVSFVPRTHYVFTAGKDGSVKYWDADKFEELLELKGHQGEVWALAVSSLGDFVVTGSHDRGLRRWERTEDPFFVEDDNEKRLESLFEEDLGREDDRALAPDGAGVIENGSTVAPAGRKTLETVSAADAIVEAMDLASSEEDRIEEAAAEAARRHGGNMETGAVSQVLQPNPLLLGLSPSDYVLRAVSHVRGSDLEQAMLLVPFTDALRLLSYLIIWLRKGIKVEVLCRVATLLLRVHMHQVMATPAARPVLTELQGLLRGPAASSAVVIINTSCHFHFKRELANEQHQRLRLTLQLDHVDTSLLEFNAGDTSLRL
jgi:U3 small nucleolar RNA-associated protein 12